MAMSSLFHKASHTIVPLTIRAIGSPRILSSSVIRAAEHGGCDVHKRSFGFSQHTNFSTVSDHELKQVDEKLIKVLKSQIKSFNPSDIRVPESPTGFPFEIEDVPGEDGIKLKRELDGEKIVVEVYDPRYPESWTKGTTGISDDSGSAGHNSTKDSRDHDEPQKRSISFNEPYIQVTVNIIKENGTKLQIYFWANVGYIGHSNTSISKGFHAFEKIELNDEDYWRAFVRVRGIDDSIGKFMIDYMKRREDRYYSFLLNKLGESVKELSLSSNR